MTHGEHGEHNGDVGIILINLRVQLNRMGGPQPMGFHLWERKNFDWSLPLGKCGEKLEHEHKHG